MMKRKFWTFLTALALTVGVFAGGASAMAAGGTASAAAASPVLGEELFPYAGMNGYLGEGETEKALTDPVTGSWGSMAADSPAKIVKEGDNAYMVLSYGGGGKAFSSFFAFIPFKTDKGGAGEYVVSMDLKGAGTAFATDNIGFRFAPSSDDISIWSKWDTLPDKGDGWKTFTHTYEVSPTMAGGIDSFSLWYNTRSLDPAVSSLYIDNLSIKKVQTGSDAPSVDSPAREVSAAEIADVVFSVDLKGQAFTSLAWKESDLTLEENTDYTLDGTSLTVKKELIELLAVGENTFVLTTAGGSAEFVIEIVPLQPTIPDKAGYTLENTLKAGDFEKYDEGLVFNAGQTEEAWGSVALDDPGVIATYEGSKTLRLQKKEGSNKIYASAFAMTSPEIAQDDVVTFTMDYKLAVSDPALYLGKNINFCFVGGTNLDNHRIPLDGSNPELTEGENRFFWPVTYTALDNGFTRVSFDFVIDRGFLTQTNSMRFLFPLLEGADPADALYIDNVKLEKWVKEGEAELLAPTIEDAAKEFDKDNAADVTFTVDLKDYNIGSIKLGETTLDRADYALDGNTLSVKKEYLASLENSEHAFTLTTLGGSATFTITVRGGEKKAGCGCGSAGTAGMIGGGLLMVAAAGLAVVLTRRKRSLA